MNSLGAATGLFTVIPVPAFEVDRRLAARAMAAFPWLGALLGAASGAVLWAAWQLAGPLLGAMLGLALLAGLTGAMHLDGVADTADGLGSRRPPDEALTIMRKSDIGPMGVATLVLVLLVDAAALASMPSAVVAAVGLAGAAALGRLAITLASVSTRSARQHGFGALFVGVTRPWVAAVTWVAVVGLVLAGAWVAGGQHAALAAGIGLAAATLAGALWSRHLLVRLGGWTGDTFGSLIEVVQAVFLVAFALAA
ncbi:adenosylcobinamide-GDP ribazoletransferase [Tessaracoccus lubricantis]|uniref:Adenosylcobinamide-GDP ribazoletransferase n=1 Tax=Tessaracoccus lubricantis TaxID=545543 RepID=A0ABP9FE72_9ACTN